MHYYLCGWESFADVDGQPTWQPSVAAALPAGVAWSSIDLRPDPGGDPATGYVLLACASRPSVDPADAEYLGESLDGSPTTPNRRGIESRLGLPRDALSGTYRSIVVDLLTVWGDDTGTQGRWKSLKPPLTGQSEIWLGGELIWQG